MTDQFHPGKCLPDCMMPDGGECCPGYVALYDAYWHLIRGAPAQRPPETEIAEGRQLCECPQCGRNHWHLGTPLKPKATIEELEAMLNSESTDQVEILPDGTVRRSALTSTECGVPEGHELCSSCGRLFKFGETCSRGGCPCGGDV